MYARLKRWGNSLGLIVPSDLVRGEGLREGDVVEFELRGRIPTPEDLCGTVKFRTDLGTLLREVEEGWEDR